MSVIGPRPQLVRDLVFMSKEERKRHTVKPGLCCAGIYDRNFAHKKIWFSFRFEYVHRVFYDKSP